MTGDMKNIRTSLLELAAWRNLKSQLSEIRITKFRRAREKKFDNFCLFLTKPNCRSSTPVKTICTMQLPKAGSSPLPSSGFAIYLRNSWFWFLKETFSHLLDHPFSTRLKLNKSWIYILLSQRRSASERGCQAWCVSQFSSPACGPPRSSTERCSLTGSHSPPALGPTSPLHLL